MTTSRNRISISLSDGEYEQILAVADVLGVKPTRVVHDCLSANLAGYLEAKRRIQQDINLAKMLKSQADWTDTKRKPLEKAKTRKKKSR
jgi:hypothetical protein